MKRKLISVFSFILICATLLTACTKQDVKNEAKKFIGGNKPQAGELNPCDETVVPITDKNNYYFNEFVSFGEEPFPVYEFSAYSINVFNNLEESKLALSDFFSSAKNSFVNTNGTFNNDNVLVIVEMAVKQVGGEDVEDDNIAMMRLKNGKYQNNEPMYFSFNQTEDITRSDIDSEYYHFSLKKGQEINYKIGWFVPKNDATPENFIISLGSDHTKYKYITMKNRS